MFLKLYIKWESYLAHRHDIFSPLSEIPVAYLIPSPDVFHKMLDPYSQLFPKNSVIPHCLKWNCNEYHEFMTIKLELVKGKNWGDISQNANTY